MSIILAIVLGLVQAFTEFLPVSSSGHLVVFQVFLEPYFGGGKTPLLFDVVLHVATLLATLVFLRGDVLYLLKGVFQKGERGDYARHAALLVIIGTLPAVVVGALFHEQFGVLFSSVNAAAYGFVFTTVVLICASRSQKSRKLEPASSDGVTEGLSWKLPSNLHAFLIGCAQAIAIYPGVSRSGSTIAIALLLGCASIAAVRFSFLLSIPAIIGAMVLEGSKLKSFAGVDWIAYGAGFLVAFVFGLLAIQLLVLATRQAKLGYFAIYTAILSASLFLLAG